MRLFAAAIFVIGLSAATAMQADDDNPPPPNIVVILADDLGFGDLGCQGARDLRTPHIDELAVAGLRMTNFYANCTVCSPTRASLMTGRYPELVGVPGVIRTHPDNSWGYLDPSAVTLPDMLRQRGYRTALVGKWHLGLQSPNVPNDRGFDHFHGWLGDMMDDYYTHLRHDINYMRLNQTPIEPEGHATDLFSDWASEFLRKQTAERPFFLYLAYNAPHTPIQPPDDWLDKVRQREPNMTLRRAALVALIEHMDHGIGQVMSTLRETGLAENTIVVVTSDNGGQVNVGATNGPHRGGKQDVYEGGHQVPLIVVWPDRIAASTVSDFRGMTMDLYPTLCAAAGVLSLHEIDGRSLLPIWLGYPQEGPLREFWFFTRREGGIAYGGKTIDAVIHKQWKLLQNSPFGPQEMYNLQSDPLEEHDLARSPDHQPMFRVLASESRRHRQRSGAVRWQPATD